MAYQTGKDERVTTEGITFVQPFPSTGVQYEIAQGGRPTWSRDGKELFYIPAAGRLMVAAVTTQPRFSIGIETGDARIRRIITGVAASV